jgi:protein-S-isoprenylcysteine O-methyltransferase Ste14
MRTSVWLFVLAGLLLGCLSSFLWGMLKFFSRPAGAPAGAKAIALCGIAFGALHLYLILESPEPAAVRALFAGWLYVCAFGLFWWAIRVNLKRPLSAAFSPDVPVHLMQEGPYRFIRHPFYCSYLLAWTAGAVATGRPWLLLTVGVMFAIYLRAAHLEEEKFSMSPLARSYGLYRARTGLFLPNPFKLMTAWSQVAE